MSSPQYSPRKDPFLIATGVRSPKPRAPTFTTSSGGAGRFPKLWFVHASPQGHVRRLQMICIIRLIQRSPQPDVGAQRHAGVELCMRGRLTKMLRLISRNGCGLRALRLRRAAVLGSQSGGSENSRLQVSPFSSSHAGSGKINPSKKSGTPPDESCTGVPRSEWGNCSSVAHGCRSQRRLQPPLARPMPTSTWPLASTRRTPSGRAAVPAPAISRERNATRAT